MKNVTFNEKPMDGHLLIEIDLAKDFGPSTSGKTIIVASTEGSAKVTDAHGNVFYIGLNVYKYPPKEKR